MKQLGLLHTKHGNVYIMPVIVSQILTCFVFIYHHSSNHLHIDIRSYKHKEFGLTDSPLVFP